MTQQRVRTSVSLARRIIVGVIIGAFALAAIGGIVVLLGGELGETAGKVLLTTAIVGAFSVAVLCCASLVGKRLQLFGYVGSAIAVLTAAWVLWVVWIPDVLIGWDTVGRIMGTGIATTIAFALASLLLLLADRRRQAVRVGLWITMVLFAVVLGMVIYLQWAERIDGDLFPRTLGIVAILAALGAIVVPVLSLLMPDAGRPGHAGATHPHIDAALAARLTDAAARRGMTVEQLVAPVLPAPAADDVREQR